MEGWGLRARDGGGVTDNWGSDTSREDSGLPLTNNSSSCPIFQSKPELRGCSVGAVRVVPHSDAATFGTGEYASNALRAERWTKLNTLSGFLKRTSAFAGWTFTSTSAGGISRKSAVRG